MERCFEKISYEQFCKDICNDRELYDNFLMPRRKTKFSAGYDFYMLQSICIKPNERVMIPTGIKARMCSDDMLFFIIRSSLGIKNNIILTNQVGVIDCDYYNNSDNEGHMWISLQNNGDKEFIMNRGDRFVQGIFLKYLTCGDYVEDVRSGGIGSTTKGDEENE